MLLGRSFYEPRPNTTRSVQADFEHSSRTCLVVTLSRFHTLVMAIQRVMYSAMLVAPLLCSLHGLWTWLLQRHYRSRW